MRKTLSAILCASLLGACAAVRQNTYRPEDCYTLGREARAAEAWHTASEYTAMGLGAGTALAEAAKDSKALTLSFAVAALVAGAVGIGAESTATAARREWIDNCPTLTPEEKAW
jgi:hypothetical protein